MGQFFSLAKSYLSITDANQLEFVEKKSSAKCKVNCIQANWTNKFLLFPLFLFVLNSGIGFGQCTNATAYGTITAPTVGVTTITTVQ